MPDKTPQNTNQVFNMVLPRKGPLTVPMQLDFIAQTEYDIDLSQLVDNGQIDFISGVYINNVGNDDVLEIECNGTVQEIPWPAQSWGYLPLMVTNPPKIKMSSTGGVLIDVIFYNIPMLPFCVQPNSGGGGGGGDVNITEVGGNAVTDAVPVSIADPVPVTISDPITVQEIIDSVTVNDGGGSLTVDISGDVQVLPRLGAIPNEQIFSLTGGDDVVQSGTYYWTLFNPSGNGPVTLNLAGNDATVSGIEIPAGGGWVMENGSGGPPHVAGTNGDEIFIYYSN